MKTLLSSLLLLINFSLFAQTTNTQEPPYKQFPTAPPLKLLLADSTTVYTREDLPKKKAVLYMLFSPECDHCRHQTDSVLANIKKFKDIQIVMATVLPFERLKRFYNEYQLEKYPNIVAGRDFQFLLPGFFQTHSLPVLGLYDRKKNLIEVNEGSMPVVQILSKFGK